MLDEQQKIRYCRQLLLPEIDEQGQHRLLHAVVLIVGMGGLGCACATYLAGAGLGKLILVDNDIIALSNLHRQPLYDVNRVGQHKVTVARQRLLALNPDITIESHTQFLSHGEPYLGQKPDLILDCSDNMATRFYLNQLSRQLTVPLLTGAATGMEGQFISFSGQPAAPCFGCLYHPAQTPQRNCLSQGISGPVVAMMGLVQAQAAINRLVGINRPDGTLQRFSGRDLNWQTLSVSKNPECTECGASI
ncbi:MAG: ThiF family adenylyltransferase [Aestuariibacter sp.]